MVAWWGLLLLLLLPDGRCSTASFSAAKPWRFLPSTLHALFPPVFPVGLGPLSALQLAASVVSLLLLPLLFVDVRKGLSRLSAAGLASCGLLITMVLALLFIDPHREGIPQQVRRGQGRE